MKRRNNLKERLWIDDEMMMDWGVWEEKAEHCSGESNNGQHLSPSAFPAEPDELSWRKDVRNWALKIRAFADGGDTKACGMRSALSMILFHSLP